MFEINLLIRTSHGKISEIYVTVSRIVSIIRKKSELFYDVFLLYEKPASI